MSAILSPAEQAEITRFGIHDLDILADMEEHADDIVPCFVCETKEAEYLLTCRGGCGRSRTLCGVCLAGFKRACRRTQMSCKCGFVASGTGVESAVKVVPL